MDVLVVEPGYAPYEKSINGLDEMQATVGGLIQAIYPYEEQVAIVCNTEEFLGHLRESANILCQTSGLICEFDAPVTTKTLCLDAGAVIQVYENLMSNAIRFAKSKVTIRCEYKANSFSITVSDDGKGFSNKDLLKADKPYYSGESQKQEYHFGLGLHICRTLCEKHGGNMELKNNLQGGAKVTVFFR